jgi:hypothetical protein
MSVVGAKVLAAARGTVMLQNNIVNAATTGKVMSNRRHLLQLVPFVSLEHVLSPKYIPSSLPHICELKSRFAYQTEENKILWPQIKKITPVFSTETGVRIL